MCNPIRCFSTLISYKYYPKQVVVIIFVKMVLSKQVVVQNGDSRYPCKLCPKTYLRKDCLTRHIKHCHPSSVNRSTKCDICNSEFSSCASVISHKRRCGEVTEEQRIQCTKCLKKFPSNLQLNRHTKSCGLFKCKKKNCKNQLFATKE